MTDYEKVLLGQMIQDENVFVKASMMRTDFISREANIIYQGIEYLIGKGVRPDIVNLSETCKKALGDSGAILIATLTDKVTTTANWEWYAQKVKEEGMRQQLKMLFAHSNERLASESSFQIMATVQAGLDKIATREQKYDIVSVKDAVSKYVETTEKRYHSRGQLPGISTGYTKLDETIMGLQDECLIVVGARPSDGKTALMKEISTHIGLHGTGVGVISTESSISEFMNRTFSGLAEINSQQLKAGNISKEQFGIITKVAGKVYDSPIWLYDEPNATLESIEMVCRRMVLYNQVKIIFIDYLQNISHYIKGAPRHEAVADISSRLKGLARRYQIPIVVMAQLTRPESGQARNKKPQMHDLGDSRKIEQDADVIVMIWHEKEDVEEKVEIRQTQFLVRKNRDGPLANIQMDFEPWFVRFKDYKGGRVDDAE